MFITEHEMRQQRTEGDNDGTKPAAMIGTLFAAFDDKLTAVIDIINTIKRIIKVKAVKIFKSIDYYRIHLFKSTECKELLTYDTKWNPLVTWGTKQNPVYVSVCSPIHIDAYEYPEKIEQGQTFIKSIMEPYANILLSDGMKILPNVLNLETGVRYDIVLRNITENFWQKVIDATDTTQVCATGTPGVGKTATTCILIRLLLKQKKSVIYHIRNTHNSEFIYIFTPTHNSLDVKVVRKRHFDYYKKEFNNPSVYYLVDPGQTTDNCNLPDDFKGKVIIVALPDEGHWGASDFIKFRGGNSHGCFLYFPVWSLHEMICAKKYFALDLSDEEIISRYEKVGGVPSHIFVPNDVFLNVLQHQKYAINRLTSKQLNDRILYIIYRIFLIGQKYLGRFESLMLHVGNCV